MARRPFCCPACSRQLGMLMYYIDRRGRRRQRLVLERHVETRWRWLRLHIECECGESVRAPDGADVVHRS